MLTLREELMLELLLLLLQSLHLEQLDLELKCMLLLRSNHGKAGGRELVDLILSLQHHELALLLGEGIMEGDGGHGNAGMIDIEGLIDRKIRKLRRRMARELAAQRSGLRWIVCPGGDRSRASRSETSEKRGAMIRHGNARLQVGVWIRGSLVDVENWLGR